MTEDLLVLRTRPVIVQARPLREDNQRDIAEWVHGWTYGVSEVRWHGLDGHIDSARVGDWIVRNGQGRFRRMSEQLMFTMYERVVR